MQGTKQWSECIAPFSAPVSEASPRAMFAGTLGLTDLIATLGSAQRGLLVVAEVTTSQDGMAALAGSRALGWPLVADALSGAVPAAAAAASAACQPERCVCVRIFSICHGLPLNQLVTLF